MTFVISCQPRETVTARWCGGSPGALARRDQPDSSGARCDGAAQPANPSPSFEERTEPPTRELVSLSNVVSGANGCRSFTHRARSRAGSRSAKPYAANPS